METHGVFSYEALRVTIPNRSGVLLGFQFNRRATHRSDQLDRCIPFVREQNLGRAAKQIDLAGSCGTLDRLGEQSNLQLLVGWSQSTSNR